MLISTIIPIYNSSKYLERCLDSMLVAQIEAIPNEIILVNDGSTDNSLDICKQYATKHKNIKVFSQANRGLSSARNTGLRNAIGEYISFVDSDDFVSNDYFDKLSKGVTTSPDVLTFGYNRVEGEKVIKRNGIKSMIDRGGVIRAVVNSSFNQELWFVVRRIYKRSFLTKYNIKFDEKVLLGEDSIFTLEVLNNLDKMEYIDANLYNYVDNPQSLTQIKYKSDLLEKLISQFSARNKIKIRDVVQIAVDKDISNYYINHSLFWFLVNVRNSPNNKVEELREIRNSIIYNECFKNYSYSLKHPKKALMIKLFEMHQFRLLLKLIK